MTEHSVDAVSAPPELDPGTLAAASFSRTRKGFEPAEVRAMLGRAADALRAWRERDDRLVDRLAELERRLDASQELDEGRLTAVLGEETARIVAAARAAATEIRSKAEQDAARLVEERSTAAAAEAEAMAAEASALRDEAERLRDDAAAAAAGIRSEAQEYADRVRSEASAEHDRLLEAARVVLDERTAEAESVAAGIREAAQIELDAARADGVGLRDEARDAAAAEVDRARVEGRAMVEEARHLRRQMLQDLAERRRTARRQIEAARAGRDRIAESLAAAGERVAQVISELATADEHAQRAADAAAASVSDDLSSVVAEFETGLTLGGLALLDDPSVDDPDDDLGSEPSGASASTSLMGEHVGDAGPAADDQVDGHEDGDGRPAAPTASPDPVGDEPTPGATVHDLFERIRAERERSEDEDRQATDDDLSADARSSDDEDEWSDTDGSDEVDGPDDTDDTHDTTDATGGEALDLTDRGLAPVVVLEQPGRDDGERASEVTGTSPVPDATSTDVVVEVEADAAIADARAATSVLDRRDELLLPVEKALTRTLKRLVSDEQNEVLDRLRRMRRGLPDVDSLLPDDGATAFSSALRADFVEAADAGARFWEAELGAGVDRPATLDHDVLDGGLELRVDEMLSLRRAHLQRALEHADADGAELAELGDHVRAAYREWRTQSVPQLAGDLAASGFALGEQAAAAAGTSWCWVADHGGLPCSDAEDNALAGAVTRGEPFPTGDVIPPAHPGCRCILVPARR